MKEANRQDTELDDQYKQELASITADFQEGFRLTAWNSQTKQSVQKALATIGIYPPGFVVLSLKRLEDTHSHLECEEQKTAKQLWEIMTGKVGSSVGNLESRDEGTERVSIANRDMMFRTFVWGPLMSRLLSTFEGEVISHLGNPTRCSSPLLHGVLEKFYPVLEPELWARAGESFKRLFGGGVMKCVMLCVALKIDGSLKVASAQALLDVFRGGTYLLGSLANRKYVVLAG